MSVAHLEVLVEEPSMEAALLVLLPKLVGSASFSIHAHQGKPDLLSKLPGKLAAYAKWIPPDWRVVVILDRDADDCVALKRKLETWARDAGLPSRPAAPEHWVVVNRLAIEELEAWYFGDWDAVRAAYPRVPKTVPRRQEFRVPDAIQGGTWEAFERVLQGAGYFKTGIRKIEAARAVCPRMHPARNRSASFQALRDVLAEATA